MSHQEQAGNLSNVSAWLQGSCSTKGSTWYLPARAPAGHTIGKNTFVLFYGELEHTKSMQIFPLILEISACVHVYVLTKHDGQYFTQQCHIKLFPNMTAGWLYYMQTKIPCGYYARPFCGKMIPGVM